MMVKLNASFVKKKCSEKQSHKSLTKEIDRDQLRKTTHLFLDEQYIDKIDEFNEFSNLKVIYLRRNSISRIENLDFATNLTHLYLQHNEISKIENLDCLINLRKLYLGYNNITVIEGLENLSNLTELHVEKQRLAFGERLCFDPRTALTLSACLEHLNISDNKLTSIREINNFARLRILEAKDNLINNIEDLTETISSLRQLEDLQLQGNPVTKIYRYRENLIANSNSLLNIDDKTITENSRIFLKNFKSEKLHQSRKKLETTLSEDITNSLNLPPAFRRSVSRAMFQNINPKFSFPSMSITGDAQTQVIPPFKSTPAIKGLKDDHILPRPFWKNKSKKQNTAKNEPSRQSVGFLSNL